MVTPEKVYNAKATSNESVFICVQSQCAIDLIFDNFQLFFKRSGSNAQVIRSIRNPKNGSRSKKPAIQSPQRDESQRQLVKRYKNLHFLQKYQLIYWYVRNRNGAGPVADFGKNENYSKRENTPGMSNTQRYSNAPQSPGNHNTDAASGAVTEDYYRGSLQRKGYK